MTNSKCDELRAALAEARASLEPPARDSAFTAAAEPATNIDPGDTEPDASAEVWARIRALEQALREAGCE